MSGSHSHSHSHGHSHGHGHGDASSSSPSASADAASHQPAPLLLTVGVVTVSDRCTRGEAEDVSGAALEREIRQRCSSSSNVSSTSAVFTGAQIVRRIVPDDQVSIESTLLSLCRSFDASVSSNNFSQGVDIVFTTGGTGFTPRDVTPEATRAVIEKECQNLSLKMALVSLEKTPFAALSRAVCGIRGQTLIINLPGSLKAVLECLDAVWPVLRHAVGLVRDERAESKPAAHKFSLRPEGDGSATSSVASTQNLRRSKDTCSSADLVLPPLPQGDTGIRRQSAWPLVPVAEARAQVLQLVDMAAGAVEHIEVRSANEAAERLLGRILAADICAQDPLPPFRASMKDGFAVVSSDGVGTFPCSTTNIVAGAALDDRAVSSLRPGVVARIMTGAPIPPGADAVVMVERTVVRRDAAGAEFVEILDTAQPGQDIREIGSDISKGDVVLERNRLIGPAEVGLLATVGVSSVPCLRTPVIGVLSTGDELQEPFVSSPDKALHSGKIRDSNRSTLIAAIRSVEPSARIVDLGIANDTQEAVEACFERALVSEGCDLILTSGGVSMGETDYVQRALQTLGCDIHFGRVLMKPGKPCTFASRKNSSMKRAQLVFGLPGNPVSAFVCFHLFAAPAIRKFSGRFQDQLLPYIVVQTADDLLLDPERPEFHRAVAIFNASSGRFVATSTGSQRSSRLLSARNANVLLELPQASGYLAAGTRVKALVVGSLV